MSSTVPPTLPARPIRLEIEVAPDALAPGTPLRHFRVERRIASGGMGDVYLGFDTSLNRPVALKTIRPELARDPSFLQRFVREAQAQANVVHPHVVQVYFVGEHQGLWFMAMQLVDGGSLQDALDRGAKLRWQEVSAHFLGLAEGLLEAGRLGIVHRDIKPANVLVDRFGSAHLADFGLAMVQMQRGSPSETLVRSPLQTEGTSQLGSVMGTLPYMSPEQLRGEALDERADIWGLGATVYHLLTGQPPLTATTPAEALAALGDGLPPVRRRAPGVPGALARVVDRCLAREPTDRYASHAELLRDVRRSAPQPQVAPASLTRLLAFVLDLAVFAAILRWTYQTRPWLAPGALGLCLAAGVAGLGATPGQWMMRLRVRTAQDGDVSLFRGLVRLGLAFGWFLPLALALHALYTEGSLTTNLLGLAAVGWTALVFAGGLGALAGSRRTLVDRLTGTRVLVDIR